MPKRESAELNFSPQLKKRISDVDVPCVYDPQAVYNKTLDLLYNRTKCKSAPPPRQSFSSLSLNCFEAETKNRFKQMTLNNNCQLQLHQLLDHSKEVSLIQFDKCSFCERLSCFTDLMECMNCQDLFCNNCSFLWSDDNRALCLSCFK